MSLRILLIYDVTIVREGLRALLEKQFDDGDVLEWENDPDGLDSLVRIRPDIVVLDMDQAVVDDLRIIREMTARMPDVKIICLSVKEDRRTIDASFRAGARGYILKDCAHDELVGAIRTVADNRTYLSALAC